MHRSFVVFCVILSVFKTFQFLNSTIIHINSILPLSLSTTVYSLQSTISNPTSFCPSPIIVPAFLQFSVFSFSSHSDLLLHTSLLLDRSRWYTCTSLSIWWFHLCVCVWKGCEFRVSRSQMACTSGGKPEQFPEGLRVLVVDDDIICLRVVEQMLRKCMYQG